MKKHAKTIKRFVAMALSVVMVISLFPNGALRAFAEELAKYSHMTPVVSTTFAEDEVTLYKDVESKEETKVSGVSGIEIELYKKITVDDDVYYQYYYVDGDASEELQATMSEYMVVSAEDVAYTEPTPEPTVEPTPEPTVEPTTSPSQGGMLGATPVELPATIADEDEPSPGDLVSWSDTNNGVTVEQVTAPYGAELIVTPYLTVPPAGIENGLIWNTDTSVFYDIKIMYNGEQYFPEEDDIAEATISADALAFLDGEMFSTCHFRSVDEINISANNEEYAAGNTITISFPGYGVIGVSQRTSVVEGDSTVTSVVPKSNSLTFYDWTYADFFYKTNVPVTEEDVLTVYSKDTITLDDFTFEVYCVDYFGENQDILDAIGAGNFYVLCDDVEEYSPVIPTTPQTLTDKNGTGITVSGDLPEGVILEVTEIPSEQVGLIVDTNLFPLGTTTKAYDIKLVMPDGSEYDPNGYVKIKITKDNLEMDGSTGLVVYSNHDEQTDIIGPVIYGGNNFNLSVENTGKYIFTDLFKEAGLEEIEGKFNKETVTLYRDLFPGSPIYTVENATKKAVTSSMYLVDQNNVKWRMLNEDFVDADGERYAWVKDADITQCVLLPEQTLVDETTGIKVKGKLPEGVQMTVTPVSGEDVELDEMYRVASDMFMYDIKLLLDGQPYQPETEVSIIFPEEMCQFENGLFYYVYHMHDDGTVELLGPYGYVAGDIRITVNSFSIFGFSDTFEYEEITEDVPMVFTTSPVDLYQGHEAATAFTSVNVTENDIVYPYYKYTFNDGTVKYYVEYRGQSGDENFNQALYNAVNGVGNPPASVVNGTDVKEYVPTVEQTLTDINGTGITVNGKLPAGTSVIVTEKSVPSDWNTMSYPLGKHTKIFDISLSYKGEKYQPDDFVKISIPKDTLAMPGNRGMAIYHVHDEGNVDAIGPVVYKGNNFNLTVESFSDFVFTDAFGEGSAKGWRGFLNKDSVTVYSNIFPGNESFVFENAYDYEVKGDVYYTAEDGSMWMMLETPVSDGNGNSYDFVKSEDVRITYLDGVCVVMPTVGYTQVAQPRIISALSAAEPQMAAAFGGRALLANSNARATAADPGKLENGLFTSKNVSGNETDGYTITLEAYVTGNVRITSQSVPTDIVLVLDQSGSMDGQMGSYSYNSIYGKSASSYYNTSSPVYFKVGDVYYPVTITKTGDTNMVFTEYTGKNYNTNSEIYAVKDTLYVEDENGVPCKVTAWRYEDWMGTYYYQYSYTDSNNDTNTTGWTTNLPDWKFGYLTDNSTYTYTYYYIDANGTQQSQQFVGDNATLPAGYYTATFGTSGGGKRINALRTAVQTFVEAVAADAIGDADDPDDDVNHRIAVVGFAQGENGYNSNSRYDDDYDDPDDIPVYENTELFVGSTSYTYNAGATSNSTEDNNAAQDHYADAMQNMNTTTGLNNIRATVGYDPDGTANDIAGVLAAKGATYVDLGIEMANGILEAEKDYTYNDDETQRNKVVIVFTDGTPGWSGKWGGKEYDTNDENAGAVADKAIDQARTTKNTYGATVYTIGIFSGADAGKFVINGNNVTLGYREYTYNKDDYAYDNSNRYMHYLSSNFTPSATATSASMDVFGDETFPRTGGVPNGDSFYLSASNAEELNSIFQKLSENVNGGSDQETLTESTIVKDIISPYFKLPTGATAASIRAYTADYIEDPDNKGTGIFTDRTAFAAANVEITGADNKTINVKNFNFADNWVGTTTNADNSVTYHGKKLIIEIPIVVNPDFLGGLNVPTNNDTSGIYVSETATEAMRPFNVPKVDVSLKNIQPVLQDQHIYVSTPADLDDMLAGTDTDARYEYRIVNSNGTLSPVYDFDGINNEYVNVTYTVKDGSTVVKTLTIPADSISGEWKFGDSVVNALVEGLTADKTYTITCQLTEKTDPAVKSTEKSDTGTVYVYKPEVTYKDSTYYYGIAKPDPAANLTAGPIWKNPTQGIANTTTMGTAPTISFAYTPSETVDKHITGKLTPDGVDITFTVGATANGMNLVEKQAITFVHTPDTNITNCPFNAANGQFMWHIVKPTVQFADKGVHYGATLGAADTKTAYNNVTSSWIYKEGVTPTAVEGTQPTITFGYDNDLVTNGGTVNTTSDITVPVTVYLDGTAAPTGANIIKSSTCAIKGDSTAGGFKLHVYTPVVTFDDTGMYYDGTTITDFSKNFVSEKWLCGDIAEAAMITTKPTLSYAYTPASIAPTTDDVYVNVVAKANSTELAEGTTVEFKHVNCTGETFDKSKGEFIVHIFTPAVQFKDSNVYLGAAKPADASFAANTGAVTWANANNVTVAADNMLNSKPRPTFSYEIVDETNYITDGVITSVNDIPVKATVKVGEADITTATAITHENPCTAIPDCTYTQPSDGTSHFVLHVFAPVIPFQDTTVYYGDAADIAASICKDEITWKRGTVEADPAKMTGTKPTTFEFDIVWDEDNFISTGSVKYVNTTSDIPFDVTEVLIGSSEVNFIDKVTLTHKDCEENEVMPDYSTGNKAEFVIHVETVDLEVSKTVKDPQGKDLADGKDYTFTVEFTGQVDLATIKQALNGATATDYTVSGNKITFELKHGDVIKFTELPVGLYKVTEADPGDAYETTVNGATGLSNAVTLSKDITSGTMAFVNTLTIADLLITKNVPAASYNAEDTFVFDVDMGSNTITVVINSGTMVEKDGVYSASIKVNDINVGTEVKVTEDTSWSWRYQVTGDATKTTTITADGGSVTFENTNDNDKWLSSEAYAENKFTAVTN